MQAWEIKRDNDSSKYSFNNVLVYINQNNIKRRERRGGAKQTKVIVPQPMKGNFIEYSAKKSTIIDSTTGSFNVKIKRLKIVKH